ncbi:MAG: EAL domain-containing protein [Gammaproteobacteria bacterium]|nr:EAL domain-containing protein [Gammaproteobacteria bacterium]
MKDKRFYTFLNKQIPVMMVLSLFPGLAYILLGWLNDIHVRAIIWYTLIVAASIWGYRLYKIFDFDTMSSQQTEKWNQQLSYFFYTIFVLWALIFILYANETTNNLHYIAIFTEIGASVVASTLLSPDKKLYQPIILILMIPLIFYFFSIGEWYSYVLTLFACIFTWVLFYAANSSYDLLMKANYQASHDVLTKLNNRYHFINYLQQMMNSLQATKKFTYLLLIDLDHFKTINDSLGHDVGDKLLKEVSHRIRQNTRVNNMVARLGGDEFIICGPEISSLETCRDEAMSLARNLIESLKQTYIIDQHHLYISSSIGVSLVDSTTHNANNFIKEADIAMYEVKAKGRDGVYIFDDEMSARVESRLEIERLLHFALNKNEITLHFQPQLNEQKRIIGAETLVRWNNDTLGLVSPVDFIPVAEQTGIIVELGNYIIETAFKTLHKWENDGIELSQLSINISMRQFFHYRFVEDVTELAKRHLPETQRNKIVFELTETIVAEDIEKVIEIIGQLKQLGIHFSMDDFGTGYSSLSYLRQLPIDELKIDRSFVSTLNSSINNEDSQAMIITILTMAKIFNLRIVAEGVETEYQFDFLTQYKCDIYQGFHFSKPLSEDDFIQYYLDNQ